MNDQEYWELEFQRTQDFSDDCSPEYQKHAVLLVDLFLNNHPIHHFSTKDKHYWDSLIGSNPILQRLIYYAYSPSEALEWRLSWAEHIMEYAEYIVFVLNYPEIQDSPLLLDFLIKLDDKLQRVFYADIRKQAGAKESIANLRESTLYSENIENDGPPATRHIVDMSPLYRMECTIKEDAEELNIYILNTDPGKNWFTIADAHLIRWMQKFREIPHEHESAYDGKTRVYIYGRDGKLKKPPRGHRNPFDLALEPKYKPLREKIHEKYNFERDKIDRRWDLEQIFKEAIMKWDGKIPAPAYFKNALEWGFLNLESGYRQKFIPGPGDKNILMEDMDFTGGSLNEPVGEEGLERIDFLSGPVQDLDADLDVSRLMDTLTHPVDKALLIDLYDAKKHNDKPSSDAELSRQLEAAGYSITPQGLGKRRTKLLQTISEYFRK